MAPISGPTARATRSLRSASRGVGAFTGGGGSANDHPVLDFDLVAVGDAGELDHREFVFDLGHPPRCHLLVQLAQELAGHRVNDGDLVAAHADLSPRLDTVLAVEIDDDTARIHENYEAAVERLARGGGGGLGPGL